MAEVETSKGRDWLGLYALLGALALVVVAVRSAEQVSLWGIAGIAPSWPSLLATEAAIWVAWLLWAAALIPIMRRVVEGRAGRARAIGVLLAAAVAPIVLVPVVASPVHYLAFEGATPLGAYHHMVGHQGVTNLLVGAAMAGVAYGYFSLLRARRLELTAARMSAELARAQLDSLRAQLDPHFLFNALNGIAVQARRGRVEDVDRMVTRLAGLLRHSLDSARDQLVPLRVELDAMRQYLEIEQIRYGDRLRATVDVPDPVAEWVVPSFLLQPLVENAIRHGFTDPERPLEVAVTARALGESLVVTVADDGDGIGSGPEPRDGIGLGNTRARLAGLYGDRATLELSRGADGRGTRVTVTVPRDRNR
jgi:two-component system LytT family sensor kinase